jgi:hypothetical protein
MEFEEGQIKQGMIDEKAIGKAQERINDLMNRIRCGDHLNKATGSQMDRNSIVTITLSSL